MAVCSENELLIKENIRRIINQLQLMTYAADSHRSDVILGSIASIEVLLTQIKAAA